MDTLEVRAKVQELLSLESKMLYWKRVGYEPHKGQVPFHVSDARFKACTSGRRFGKTFAGPRDIGPLVFIPDTYIWVVAPTMALGVKEFRIFKADLERLQRQKVLRLTKSVLDTVGGRYLLQVKDGATIEIKSGEKKEQIKGEGLTGVIMAEAAMLDPDIWPEYVRPTLSDYHGVARFATTPLGKNWYYKLFQAAKNSPEWATFSQPSWDNPHVYPGGIDDPEIVDIKATTDEETFEQEYGAQFVSHAGLIYKEFRDAPPFVERFEILPDVPLRGWVDMGFDDPFVCLAVQVWEDNVYILDEYYRAGMTPQEHGGIMAEYFQRVDGIGYVPEYLICDPRSPDGIKDLKLTGWQAKAAPALDKRTQRDKPVIVGVKRVKRLLKVVDGKTKIHVHPRCVHMIEEFGLYEWVNNEPDPRKNNHCCFPAGTLVATPGGDRPIESLREGDVVYTHLGRGRVDVGPVMTGDRELTAVTVGGGTICCTPEHPFLTARNEWKPAEDLEGECLLRRTQPKSRSTVAESSLATRFRRTTRITTSVRPRSTMIVARFTRWFGRTRTDPSPTDLRFTTATKTRPTTTSRTSSSCGPASTSASITRRSCGRPAKLPSSGTLLQKAKHGIPNMLGKRGSGITLSENWSAKSAGSLSAPKSLVPLASALTPANQDGVVSRTSTTSSGFVSSAVQSSISTAMSHRSLAPVVALEDSQPATVRRTRRVVPVYNIATSDGTFFANGLLTMNCDALRYGVVAEVDRGYGYEEEESEEEDILGKDIEDDYYDPDEPFGMQILRQRQHEREKAERAEKARCS